jgi:hypothetical protein
VNYPYSRRYVILGPSPGACYLPITATATTTFGLVANNRACEHGWVQLTARSRGRQDPVHNWVARKEGGSLLAGGSHEILHPLHQISKVLQGHLVDEKNLGSRDDGSLYDTPTTSATSPAPLPPLLPLTLTLAPPHRTSTSASRQ